MKAPTLRQGQAAALCRGLLSRPDPLALHLALTDGGRRPDTLLFEGPDGRAFILDQAAVRAEARGHEMVLTALSHGGRNVLAAAAGRLAARVAERSADRLRLRFERSAETDANRRLLAGSPMDSLRALVFGCESLTPEEPHGLFLPGILAFDHVDLFETFPAPAADPLAFPDFLFWLAESLIVVEPRGSARLICTAFGSDDPREAERSYHGAAERLGQLVDRCRGAAGPLPAAAPEPAEPPPVEVDLSDAQFSDLVGKMKAHIRAGDVYQIVPSRTFRAACPDPAAAFARQRLLDPSPYMFFVSGPDHLLFGASPESAVRVHYREGVRMVEVKPMAGTRPRGTTADEDDRLEADLRLDEKENAEHMMLVDLARNDVARVSRTGTRRVTSLLTVERYARVMHLVSRVEGELADPFDAFHALQACLNVGTLTGAPKIRATELLRRHEATRRGPYGGAVGWISGRGELDTGVIIRSAVVKDQMAFVRAGAGIVHDSDPATETEETRRKASALLSALAGEGAHR